MTCRQHNNNVWVNDVHNDDDSDDDEDVCWCCYWVRPFVYINQGSRKFNKILNQRNKNSIIMINILEIHTYIHKP